MYWNRSAADIAAAWQAEIESKLETGATALLQAGAPDTLLTSATTLIGLQHSTVQRADVATPLLVAGGNSALWLGLLLSPQTMRSPHAPAPTLIYGGADAATYFATVGLISGGIIDGGTARGGMTSAQRAQPLGLGAQFAPRLQPGVATPWEMLPLLEAGEQPVLARDATSPVASQATADPAGDWVVWGVMLLAFCLVLSALLI